MALREMLREGATDLLGVTKNQRVCNAATELGCASAELICCYQSFQRMVKANDVLSFVTTDTTATLSVVLYSL